MLRLGIYVLFFPSTIDRSFRVVLNEMIFCFFIFSKFLATIRADKGLSLVARKLV